MWVCACANPGTVRVDLRSPMVSSVALLEVSNIWLFAGEHEASDLISHESTIWRDGGVSKRASGENRGRTMGNNTVRGIIFNTMGLERLAGRNEDHTPLCHSWCLNVRDITSGRLTDITVAH